jgi:hypothetical protein
MRYLGYGVELTKQAEMLKQHLDNVLGNYRLKRKRDRRRATYLKLGSVFLGSAVTVLLGVRAPEDFEMVLKNAALAIGALIAVLNAFDAFFDHRTMWVRRTATVARLHDLQRDFQFYLAGLSDVPADPAELERFKNRLTRILQDDTTEWLKVRSASAPDVQVREAPGFGFRAPVELPPAVLSP